MAFVETYQSNLFDDDNEEFAHLQNEDTELLIADGNQEKSSYEPDDDDMEEPETVSTRNIHEELRAVAREQKVSDSKSLPAIAGNVLTYLLDYQRDQP